MYLVLQERTLTGWGNLTMGGREGCPEEVTLELLFEVRGNEVAGVGVGGVGGRVWIFQAQQITCT